MQSRIRKIMKLVLSLICGLMITNHSASADAASEQVNLRVGVDGSFAPLSFKDSDGKLKGMDVEIAEALAKALKSKLELQSGSEEELRSKLFGGEIDIVIAGTFATFGDRHDYQTIPYVEIPGQWIRSEKSKEKDAIKTIGTISYQLLRDYFEQNKKAHKWTRIRGYEKFDSVVLALDRNEVDAIPVDSAHAPALVAKIKTPTKLVPMQKHGVPVYALIPKSGKFPPAKIEKELNKLIDSGLTAKICSDNFKAKCFKTSATKDVAAGKSKSDKTKKSQG
jgi:ABC-type amino acid transport substrate-binding protein